MKNTLIGCMGVFFMKHGEARFMSCMYVLSLTLLVMLAARGLRQAATVSAETEPVTIPLVILDAGHGGPDGGCSAADGTLEKTVNLEIVRKTDAVLGLLGADTLLVRDMDTDLSDASAQSISQKKVTDIRNRVALVNEHPDSVLVSIHQNTYPQEKYSGAQVFYNGAGRPLAELIQQTLAQAVDPSNQRQAKAISPDIYLMKHVKVPAVLIECGFLSNREEAEQLKSSGYQRQLAVAIGVALVNQLRVEDSGV